MKNMVPIIVIPVTLILLAPPGAGAQTVKEKKAEVWISTQSGDERLARAADIFFIRNNNSKDSNKIIIDEAITFQKVDGMGSSLEPATCYNLYLLDENERSKTLTALFSPVNGIGMNQMRICIGTPDFTGDPWYTYCDLEPGQTDPEMKKFSVEKDRKYIIPVLKEALKVNQELRFFASP